MLFSLDLVSPQARIAPLIHVSLIHCTRHPLPPRNHQRRWNRYFGVLKDQSLLLYSPAQHELQSLDDPVGGSIHLLQCVCVIDYAYKNKKRENILRLHGANKTEYLMQVMGQRWASLVVNITVTTKRALRS